MRTAVITENSAIVEPETKQRRRSKQERRKIVEETLQPGVSVAIVVRTHGINANQVFQWRKLYREGRLDEVPSAAQLMPVRMTEVSEEPRSMHIGSGAIQIEVGRARIRVEGIVNPDILRMVLDQLGR